jgi:hypothetical protein
MGVGIRNSDTRDTWWSEIIVPLAEVLFSAEEPIPDVTHDEWMAARAGKVQRWMGVLRKGAKAAGDWYGVPYSMGNLSSLAKARPYVAALYEEAVFEGLSEEEQVAAVDQGREDAAAEREAAAATIPDEAAGARPGSKPLKGPKKPPKGPQDHQGPLAPGNEPDETVDEEPDESEPMTAGEGIWNSVIILGVLTAATALYQVRNPRTPRPPADSLAGATWPQGGPY